MTFDSVLVQPAGGIGVTVPKFTLPDGRHARRPMVTYVPQRFVEIVLFARLDGGSSGAVYKILGKNGLSPTAWTINAAAIHNDEVSQPHADFLISKYKELLCTDADPVMAGRIRNIVLLPIATVAAVCRLRGRSPATTAFLQACAPNQLPQSWQLLQQQEEHEKEGEIDPLLDDAAADAEDADADVQLASFAAELQAGTFSTYNPKVTDEQNARAYGLTAAQIPANLRSEATTYIAFKINPLEARRASTAVVEGSAQQDLNSFYRFLGFMKLKGKLPPNVHLSLELLAHPSASTWVSEYTNFMEHERHLAFSSMANYLNGLFSLAAYVFDSEDFDVPDAVANANFTVLDGLVNLRSQAESLAKEAGLYAEKRGGWIDWKEAQEARVACLGALNAYHGVDAARKKQLLMDAIVLTIFTYGPVDRVGIIRKLRMNDTLARGPDGAYSVDLTKAMRSHKSAKFHGGTVHKLPSPTWPLIDRLAQLTQFDLLHGADKYYLFHNVNTRDALRPLTEGPFGRASRAQGAALVVRDLPALERQLGRGAEARGVADAPLDASAGGACV